MAKKPDPVELLRRSAAKINVLKVELDKTRESIAIVGMACRFPGAPDLEAYWELLSGGVDAISEVPADRWDIEAYYDPDPDVPGKMSTRYGGFIEDIDLFDPQFFSISPKEAVELDPQQRLLLEISWQALEHAGISAASLAGSRSGVYAGISTFDYQQLLARGGEAAIGPYAGTGNAHSAAVGRVSFVLGLEGPSLAVDTACSASLVALSQACQGLRAGDCDLALAGGVNAILTPEATIYFSRGRFMAPDGRCKTFDARGDGYVRGEGCGMVVLKRLSDAERDGDRVLAVVRGAAVNQDGASSGLTVPNGPAQERVIGQALSRAGVGPDEIAYVEAHGTGTPLGDPIEVQALHNALGRAHSKAAPLLTGSVKTNIGHLESAAGIAGVIKVVLSMNRGLIPAQLHFQTPSPKIAWDDVNIQVVSKARSWPQGRRLAGISSFAFQGSNAHVILEDYGSATTEKAALSPRVPVTWPKALADVVSAELPPEGLEARRHRFLPLSAKSEEALSALAQHYEAWLGAHPDADLADLAYTAGHGRSHFTERAGLAFDDADDLRSKLASLAAGEPSQSIATGRSDGRPKVAFLFTGQGSQYKGMGRALYAREPIVRAVLEHCDSVLQELRGASLLSVMFGDSEASLDDTAWTQPALYALEVALVELYRSAGINPSVVLGHSVGEYAAAYAAGVFGLEEGMRLIAARSTLMGALPEGGSMAAIFAAPDRVSQALEEVNSAVGPGVEIASDNGGHQVVSGPTAEIEALVKRFADEGVRCEGLKTSHAFHSSLLDPMLGGLETAAKALSPQSPRRTLISNVTGRAVGSDMAMDAAYWRRHARQPVQFAKSVAALAEAGVDLVLEVGPHPVLSGMLSLCWPETGAPPASIASLLRGSEADQQVAAAMADLYAQGLEISFAALFAGETRRKLALPSYPFQRRRYWAEVARLQPAVGRAAEHPLLGSRRASARGDAVFEATLSTDGLAWLSDHRVFDHKVFPAAGYIEMALAAAALSAPEDGLVSLARLRIEAPLSLDLPTTLQTLVSPSGQVEIFAPVREQTAKDAWLRHATADRGSAPEAASPIDLADLRERCAERHDPDLIYADFAALGLPYGPAFRPLVDLRSGEGECLAELVLPQEAEGDARYFVPPMLLDGALQSLGVLWPAEDSGHLYLPVGVESVRCFAEQRAWPAGSRLFAHARLARAGNGDRAAALTLCDEAGQVLVALDGLSLREAERATLEGLLGAAEPSLLYELAWRAVTLDQPEEAAAWPGGGALALLSADASAAPVAQALGSDLKARGVSSVMGREASRLLAARLASEQDAATALAGVVWIAPSADLEEGEPLEAVQASLAWLLELLQGLLKAGQTLPRGVTLVTRWAVATAAGEPVDPVGSSLWGFARSLQSEQPDLGLRLIDLGRGPVESTASPEQLAGVAALLLSAVQEPQLALRGGQLLAPRLQRAPAGLRMPAGGGRLTITKRGALEGLRVEPLTLRPPGPGEVSLAVRAAGLNFRDVLNTLGAYPGEAGDLGGEASGVVVALGEGVHDLSLGDRVFGFVGGGFASQTTTDATMLRRMPAGLGFIGAASLPVTFSTALAAFEAAGLKQGESVLIHAGAGGVGLAAIQVARGLGAKIYATASAPKQAFLRALGIDGVFDSRTTAFGEEVLQATAGAGVDMVLNSLTSEGFIDASLSCLKQGGRFVEIGKRNIWSQEEMAAARPDVGYSILALDAWMRDEPERVAALLDKVARQVEEGALTALPCRPYPMSAAPSAMRLMQQARHIGKIVLTVEQSKIRGERSYLVTGGLGSLGLETAAWLAGSGAGHLVLAGRRGPGEAARARIAAIGEDHDCRIEAVSLDITDGAAVTALVGRFGDENGGWPALGGVIHAAGVLDDALLPDQSPERLAAVLQPKVSGGWNLHRATRDLDLDFFVLYSSVAATLGAPGQSNYAAANAFLDGLAWLRRSEGLAATSVAWGPWSVGMAEDATVKANLARQGIKTLQPAAAQAALSQLLAAGQASGLVLDVEWARMSKALGGARPPLLSDLLTKPPLAGESALLQRLKAVPAGQREAVLLGYLQGELRAVLGLAEPPSPSAGFFDLGMDSLMAVELRNRLNAALERAYQVPNTIAFDHPSLEKLARHLAEQLGVLGQIPAGPPAARAARRMSDGEPIAVVGMACRFPGAPDLEAYWELLTGGVDAISEVPADRWDIEAYYDPDPDVPGKMSTRYGGFIDDIDLFDPQFFSISPKEAVELDPQQRLLLEISWRALEHAGIAAASLAGSHSGVYVGLSTSDYQQLLARGGEAAIGPYAGTGNAHSAAVGRVSFVLGLEGPSLAVDTACSASLVALSQACQGLRAGDCDLALAGGVNAILTPEATIYFSRGRFMAPDGRCKTFDARGDGYVRGEGCGMVVLKRLSDAERDGDRVLAVVRGAAVNQDGASSGLTVPNGPAQERVIGQALARAGVGPDEIAYVEAHGTGTPLGDPIEVQALHNALGRAHSKAAPLLTGSVKTNIGHLESAAGIAGVIKVVLSMNRGLIPAQLHFQTPSPKIAWDDVNIQVVSKPRSWPQGRRLAGISSFAFQGTNAHVILEGLAPAPEEREAAGAWPARPVALTLPDTLRNAEAPEEPARRHRLLPLSGKDDAALKDLAKDYLAWLDAKPQVDLADLAYSAGVMRNHFRQRAGVAFDGLEDLEAKLAALASDETRDGLCRGEGERPPKVAFLFTGQGSQRIGMGRGLYDSEPLVRAVLDRCDGVVREVRGSSLLAVMFGEAEVSLDDTAWTQPALYTLEVALVEFYRSAGIKPSVVLGHSVGEFAAAYAAGIFTLEEGLRLILARGSLMGDLPSGGAMAAVFGPAERVLAAIDKINGRLKAGAVGLSLAADNGTHQVISGPAELVEAASEDLTSAGLRCQALQTSHAFHSALLDPMLADLEAAAAGIAARPAHCTLISNVTGEALGAEELLDAAYWRRHARSPVAFAQSVASLAEAGADIVVELGPHPTLAPMVTMAWAAAGGAGDPPASVPSLKRDGDEAAQVMTALASLYAAGAPLSFAGLYGGEIRRKVALPGYPFQRRRYWAETARARRGQPGQAEHPLLGYARRSAKGEVTFESELSLAEHPWLTDHRVFYHVVMPGAAFVAMAVAAAGVDAKAPGSLLLESFQLHAPLLLSDDGESRTLQLVLEAGEGSDGRSAKTAEIYSRRDGEDGWTLHARGQVADLPADAARTVDLPNLIRRLSERDITELYAAFARLGIVYGPAFQGLCSLWSGQGEALGEVVLADTLSQRGLMMHPALLDGCFQAMAAALPEIGEDATYMPFAWESLRFAGALPERVFCHVRLRDDKAAAVKASVPETLIADLVLYDGDGSLVGQIEGFTCKRATRQALLAQGERVEDWLYEVVWRDRALNGGELSADSPPSPDAQAVEESSGLWLLAGEAGGVARRLAECLMARGQRVVLASDAVSDAATGTSLSQAFVDSTRRDAWVALLEGLPDELPLRGVVHLASLDGAGPEETAEGLSRALTQSAASALALVQALLDHGSYPDAGLWLVTSGAQVVDREAGGGLAGAALWGLGKTAALEAPDLGGRMVDLDAEALASPEGLVDELLHPDGEDHLAYRAGVRKAARLVRGRDAAMRVALPEGGAWRVVPGEREGLEGLQAETIAERPLGAGEIRVAIAAVGLNFRDVLVAIGLYPEPVEGLGGDFCGRVLEVGPDVAGLSLGQQVLGFADGALASQAVTRAELVVPAPAGHSAAALASLPSAFVTAQLAFAGAGLKRGERVLIHAGAGGVGLAAIQLAQALGAEVLATASAPKQAYLRSLGVDAVYDSRSTAFGAEILAATDGRGVDLVLNSLTGEGFIEASLACLAEGGRFVEIAKRNIWSAEEMAAARPDVAYRILAVDAITLSEPARIRAALGEIVARVSAGDLRPLPVTQWPLAETPEAMHHMRSAKQIGKIVLRAPPLASGAFDPERSYLVTGGLGGIGLQVAGWLADRGARHIVLNGRRAPEAAARSAIEALERRGVAVKVALADVSRAEQVDAMVSEIEAEMPPLAGLFHSVGVLSDAALVNQSWESFEQVLGPKVLGAWALHRATLDRDLDCFVLFSSITGVLGNAGQANYAAANAFLDQLARHRRALGLPGQSIAWGPWSGGGMAEEQRQRIEAQLRASGIGWIDPSRGLEALELLLRQDVAASTVLPADWSVMAAGGQALLQELSTAARPTAVPADGGIRQRLGETDNQTRRKIIAEWLGGEVKAVLHLSDAPDPGVGFFELGMDSLTAIEVSRRVEKGLGVKLDASVLFDYPTVSALAAHLADTAPARGQRTALVASARDEPIAIIGMACRFPGGSELESFWRLLDEGRSGIGEVPPDRWDMDAVYDPDPSHPGRSVTRAGGFIEGIDLFDAGFFRIAPVEAKVLDPQQRLLLETSWQALEDAGIDPSSLRGSRTGVFGGIAGADYREILSGLGADSAEAYWASGTAGSTAIGRISFALGLQGPAVATDTACSASLVAISEACEALRNGKADLALAGGVNALLTPSNFIIFSKAGMLAPDGLCKTFDAAADGYARGEGCGMVVLKCLSRAELDGDRILAVIRGEAINQDGASAALTAPNGPAQEQVIAEALAQAGLAPAEVDYLEAHGTGTELGDPIELRAAASAYGRDRDPERPLLIGSVKTNIGHLEAAAGVAGLIKTVLAMRHEVIPKHLNFTAPNPRIDWADLPVEVTAEATPWPSHPERPRRAGLSSFGFSGTNAHIILEAYQAGGEEEGGALSVGWPDGIGGPSSSEELAAAAQAAEARRQRVLALSGKSEEALKELARRYLACLDEEAEVDLGDLCYTAGIGRSHFSHRAALVVESVDGLRAGLAALAEGQAADGLVQGLSSAPPKIAFLFTGQGSQYLGMGRELYEREPLVRALLDRCDGVIRELRGVSLLAVMFEGEGGSLDDTQWTQPALYALEVALVEHFRAAGIEASVVMGHSVGEYAAAYAAGMFGLEEGLRLIAERGALMGSLPPGGSMAAIFADRERVAAALAQAGALDVEIASDNGLHQVVSGPSKLVEAVIERFAGEEVRCERLQTSHAFHSALLNPMLAGLEAAAGALSAGPPQLPLISNLTGAPLGAEEKLDAVYWRRHAREPVQFAKSVEALAEQGVDLVMEIGPHPVLSAMATLAWPSGAEPPASLASMRRGSDADGQAALALAALYAKGAKLDFAALHGGESRRKLALPTYPFQRQRYWVEARKRRTRLGDDTGHPLLGGRIASARGDQIFETSLSAEALPWLSEHRVFARPVFPGAGYLEMALAAAGQKRGCPRALQNLRIDAPLALDSPLLVQTIVSSEGHIEIYSGAEESGNGDAEPEWRRHAVAEVAAVEAAGNAVDLAALRDSCAEEVPVTKIYEALAGLGLDYGASFRSLTSLRAGSGEVLAEVRLPKGTQGGARYLVPPMLLDGALHGLAALFEREREEAAFLPVGCRTMQWFAEPRQWPDGSLLLAHGRLVESEGAERLVDLDLLDESGALFGRLQGFRLRRAEREALRKLLGEQDLLYEVLWRGVSPEKRPSVAGKVLLVAGESAPAELVTALRSEIESRGMTVLVEADVDPTTLVGQHLSQQEGGFEGLVYVVPDGDERVIDPVAAGKGPLAWLLTLTQTAFAQRLELPLGISLASQRAVATAAGEQVDPFAASLWGFVRSVQNEQPGLGLRLLDVASDIEGLPVSEGQACLLAEAICAGSAETQLAVRGEQVLAPRLAPAVAGLRMPSGGGRLTIAERGSFEGLRIEALAAQTPGPGEVAVAVQAIGLNFRDVLIALGAYPGEAAEMGGDAAGVVTALGEGVSDLSVGDRVFGMMGGGFASRVTTPAATLRAMPDALDFAGAATLPSTFCTAQAAFEAADLKAGRKVLIHAAAGGVGLAAIQLARAIGAEVYATASAPKRDYLRSLGITHVFDSRSTDFGAEVLSASGGGVDMVLNSLTGEGFIEASLSCLADGGHFVEIAKRNIWSPEEMTEARPDLHYTILALDQWAVQEPERIGTLLEGIIEKLNQGAIKVLPKRLFPLSDAPSAMRLMQQARHVGKIVLTVAETAIRPDRSYLVTGGLGGLGLEAAAWLAEKGARHLVLVGRNEPGEAAARRISEVSSTFGCAIETVRADVAVRSDVDALVGRFGAGAWPGLGGVFHAAGFLDDGMVTEQSWERFEPVLRPKLAGGWNLHEATCGLGLDSFVLYSSAAATMGAAGQSNYAAANAFLDGLAAMRQSAGLPATSVAWGPWAVGMAEDATVRANIERQGLHLLEPEAAHRALQTLMTGGQPCGLVLDCDWAKLGGSLGALRPPLLSDLLTERVAYEERALLKRLMSASVAKRKALLTRYLREELGAVLGLAERPGAAVGFFDLGMDSLMAVELRNRIAASLGDACQLTNTIAFDYPSVAKLAEHLASQIGVAIQLQASEESATTTAHEHGDMEEESDDQLMQQVSKILGDSL